jgi:hypothetical protein
MLCVETFGTSMGFAPRQMAVDAIYREKKTKLQQHGAMSNTDRARAE